MELPECNSTHWKSKCIDGLPTLFPEKVRKAIRGENHSINYDEYTYGKLISACVQEGLALCNEIKLNQQIKRHRLNEKKQLGEFSEQFAFDIPKQKSKERIEKKLRRAEEGKGDFSKRKKKYRQNYNRSDTCHRCGRFGHYAKDCRVKEKIKSLDVGDDIKDSLYKIMLNSDSEKSGSESSSNKGSSTSEDLKALQQEDSITSEDECSPCQQGMACEKKDDEDDLYKIYAQFKEFSLNVIDNDKVLELLQNMKDPEIRAQIIDKISNNPPKEKDHIPEEISTKEGSYTMTEVKNLFLERIKMISSPTTINDLKEDVNSLKEDILRLKEKNVVIEVRLDAIQTRQDLENMSESSSFLEGENNKLDYIYSEQKISVKYNYWDYIDGFNKVLLYENANKKHSWFIKICSNVFDRHIPNWFCKWWTLYGPSVKIFPDSYKKLYLEWVDISPKLISLQEENMFFEGIYLMYFFIEFSIPWLMKWSIEVNTTSEGFPCLQRTFYTKFWSKLLQKNSEGKIQGQEIINLINVKISKYYDTATM
ncbi:hypothetical protein H5410_021023 [Solanum commersonii]|uniref:CCHC-type domain-containing protein n=1 Tax=Solanum commersonii TaxID=4109 RepID=A0A9J5ZFZ2_SOLCO|nr:hypothetical protein H5410_021023 [Solanum commersonii]